MKRLLVGLTLGLLMASLLPAATAQAAPGRYIVVLQDSVSDPRAVASEHSRDHGAQVSHVYEHALKGYAARMSAQAAARVSADRRVAYVEADQIADAFVQDVPTGISRTFAATNPNLDIDSTDDERIDVDVAIIDTGIDFDHSDLNVVARTDCTGGGPFNNTCTNDSGDDGNGHGTHVAGTVAATDNGIGVVGMAPGARLWAVKVLGNDGSGWISWIVAGIDYVTANASSIEVANMSLGCECDSDSMDQAIASSVDKGVVYAVAAGNSDADAATHSPANHPDVITVSALADFDGAPGALGSPTCRDDEDDTLANFSNWGATIEIAAPGVCILSTWKGGGYNTISGTSMASPHTAGAAALLASVNNPDDQTDVENIRQKLISEGNFDWTDDSGDGSQEPLLDVGDATVFDPVTTTGSGDGGDTNSAPTASFTFTCNDSTLTCDFDGSGSNDPDGDSLSYSWDFGDGATGSGVTASHTYAEAGTYTVTLTVSDGSLSDSDSQSVTVGETTSTIDITGIDPTTATAGDTTATIFGTGLSTNTAVTFEGGKGPNPTATVTGAKADGTELYITISVKAGGPDDFWDVRVENADGATDVLVDGLFVDR